MSVSKSATNTTKSNDAKASYGDRLPPQFIQYRLTEAELAQARNACLGIDDLGAIITQFIDEGYKFSCSFDSYGGGIQAFITPGPKSEANKGYTLSARAPTLILAVGMLAFKHYTLFSQDWPKSAPERKGDGWA